MEPQLSGSWQSLSQVKEGCCFFQSNADLTWCWTRDLPEKGFEEVIRITQYQDHFKKFSILHCTEDVKEEFKDLLKYHYPKTRKMAISADRSFWFNYSDKAQLMNKLFEETLTKIHSTVYLFEEEVSRLRIQRFIRPKVTFECPCCSDQTLIPKRIKQNEPAAEDLLRVVSEHQDCKCCSEKRKQTVEPWKPLSFLRKL